MTKLIRTTEDVLIAGKPFAKGTLVEVTERDAALLIGIERARLADAPDIAAAPKTQPPKMANERVMPQVIG
jgi:hypothetical protein